MQQNIFKQYAKKYHELGYYPFPTFIDRLKAPCITNRNADIYDLSNMISKSRDGSNIGIGVGHQYGIVALDLDIPNNHMGGDLENKIRKILPTSNYNRVGQPGRSLYFFKSSSNIDSSKSIRDSNGETWVEFLSNGKFVIVPPSIHPLGHTYTWVEDNILDCQVEDLPELSVDIYKKLDNVKYLLDKNISSSGNKKSDGGRNNTLVSFVGGKLEDQKDPTMIIRELVEYDEATHSPPLFTDPGEFNGCVDAFTNASKFFFSVGKSILSNTKNPIYKGAAPVPKIQILDQPNIQPRKEYTRIKLPRLNGIAQEMFEYVYKNSPIPRSQFAWASTISTMSIILANKLRCRRIHPNLYSLLIAPSGYGKDVPLKFPKRLLAESGNKHLIGQSHPASDTGVIMTLSGQRERIDLIDEASTLFGAAKSKENLYLSKIADVYASLYTSTGEFYEGKSIAKFKSSGNSPNIGECHSPYITMLGAMTPTAFHETFNTSTLEKGLGARFLFFDDLRKKDAKFDMDDDYQDIPKNLLDFVNKWRSPPGNEFTNLVQPHIHDIAVSKPAKDTLRDVHNLINKHTPTDSTSKLTPIYQRGYVHVVKLAMIDAAATQFEEDFPILKRENVEWANRFMDAYINRMKSFTSENINENPHEREINSLLSFIKSHPSGISRSDLTRKFRKFNVKHRDILLKELIESEEILIKEDSPNGRTRSIYIHTDCALRI